MGLSMGLYESVLRGTLSLSECDIESGQLYIHM